MSEGIGPINGSDEPVGPPERRLLVIRPTERSLVPRVRRRLANLPALVAERLPVLWDGGRGPLAQALVAGGLVALGSVLGRRSGTTSLVPTTPPPSPARPAANPGQPSRVEFSVETEVGITTPSLFGPRTRWRRERMRIVRDWTPNS